VWGGVLFLKQKKGKEVGNGRKKKGRIKERVGLSAPKEKPLLLSIGFDMLTPKLRRMRLGHIASFIPSGVGGGWKYLVVCGMGAPV